MEKISATTLKRLKIFMIGVLICAAAFSIINFTLLHHAYAANSTDADFLAFCQYWYGDETDGGQQDNIKACSDTKTETNFYNFLTANNINPALWPRSSVMTLVDQAGANKTYTDLQTALQQGSTGDPHDLVTDYVQALWSYVPDSSTPNSPGINYTDFELFCYQEYAHDSTNQQASQEIDNCQGLKDAFYGYIQGQGLDVGDNTNEWPGKSLEKLANKYSLNKSDLQSALEQGGSSDVKSQISDPNFIDDLWKYTSASSAVNINQDRQDLIDWFTNEEKTSTQPKNPVQNSIISYFSLNNIKFENGSDCDPGATLRHDIGSGSVLQYFLNQVSAQSISLNQQDLYKYERDTLQGVLDNNSPSTTIQNDWQELIAIEDSNTEIVAMDQVITEVITKAHGSDTPGNIC